MRCALLLVASAGALRAHAGEPLAPHDLWTAWSWDPGIVLPLAITAWLYWRGLRRPVHAVPRPEVLAFAAGWLSLVVALLSPLHPLGEALFSAHMAQHEILMAISAPLLVLGRPMAPLLRGIPFTWRRPLGSASKYLPGGFTAWLLQAVALWVWHVPALFEATLRSEWVHALQHISFLFSALLFWYAIDRGSAGAGVVSVFTTGVYTTILGALLTFAPVVWYPAYSATTRAWGLTPLEDQQLGGLIMWVPAGLTYLAAGLWLFSKWLRRSELRLEGSSYGD